MNAEAQKAAQVALAILVNIAQVGSHSDETRIRAACAILDRFGPGGEQWR